MGFSPTQSHCLLGYCASIKFNVFSFRDLWWEMLDELDVRPFVKVIGESFHRCISSVRSPSFLCAPVP
eukprot:309135-Amphidinium_carterae.1